jgi:peptidoglycan DL-endopeptidase LytE
VVFSPRRVIVRFAAVSVLSAVCLLPAAALAAPALQSSDDSAAASAASPNLPPSSRTYTVADGDSLASIARSFSLSLDTLKAANPNVAADRLEVGQSLVILPGDGLVHIVAAGDSLKKIADRYSVKSDQIADVNKIDDPGKLDAGRMLFIPANLNAKTGSDGDADGKADPRTYKVQSGDTLWSVSQRFGVEPTIIMLDNNISDPKSVVAGSRLRILPAKGVESVVLQSGETMADLAGRYQIDLGTLMDYNQLDSADAAKAGARIVIPQTNAKPAQPPEAAASTSPSTSKSQLAAASVITSQLTAPSSDKGQLIASTAMKYLGARYVFGGTSPTGFDCSGFAYFVQKSAGLNVGRTLWQQFNTGARVAKSQLQVGDEVFFANTYMPGLSHAGIFLGEGKFIHANNERTGVTVSRLDDDYWANRFVGAARIRE